MENVKEEYSQQEFFSHPEPCNLIIQSNLSTIFHNHIISSVTQSYSAPCFFYFSGVQNKRTVVLATFCE